jgi:hypothetical protein
MAFAGVHGEGMFTRKLVIVRCIHSQDTTSAHADDYICTCDTYRSNRTCFCSSLRVHPQVFSIHSINICVYVCLHTYTCVYVSTCVCFPYMGALCIRKTCMCMGLCTCVHDQCMCACVSVCKYICVIVYVRMYISTYWHTYM